MAIIKKTYKDQVVDYVYQLILAGDLIPGQQIKESLLAAQMGISRAPIREAMKELIMDGLVDYRPQVGNFIPILSAKEIIDCYTTRGLLEGFAVGTSCSQFGAADYQQLNELVNEMESAANRQEHKLVVDVGGQFHDYLIRQCDNQQLLEYTNRLSLKCHILFYKHWSSLYSATEIGHRHRLILTAVRSGDAARLEQVIRDHYHESGCKIAALQQQ